MTRLMTNAAYITQIIEAAPDLAGMWDSSTFALSDPLKPPPVAGPTPVGLYRSFDQFQTDSAAHLIHPAYRWLLVDQEGGKKWEGTPVAEQRDPFRYLQDFGQYAGRYGGGQGGWHVIAAPARDLGITCTRPACKAGQSLLNWYLDSGIAGHAARYCDAVSIQSQASTLDAPAPGGYRDFTAAAAAQVRAANRFAIVLTGISTTYGTAEQMAAAVQSVVPSVASGVWLNFPGGVGAKGIDFLRLVL